MRVRNFVVLVLVLSTVAVVGCSRFRKAEIASGARQPTLTGTAYINSGEQLHFIVDVRAARIGGPKEWLPLQVAVLNRSKDDLLINRESFVLESPERELLPLASYAEFEKDYPRHRIDLRIGRDFIEHLDGKYPSPPFSKRPLEFFPLRESGVVPRDEINLRQGEMAIGFLYFHLPGPDFLPGEGRSKLLMKPGGTADNYVVDIRAYKKERKG